LEAININRSTFYVYFKDGYEILDEIEKQTITASDFSDIIIERIFHATEKKDMLELVLQFFESNKKYLPVLLSEQGDPFFRQKLVEKLTLLTTYSPLFPQIP